MDDLEKRKSGAGQRNQENQMIWRRESPARVNGISKIRLSGEEKVRRGSIESGKIDDLEKRKSGAGQRNLEK